MTQEEIKQREQEEIIEIGWFDKSCSMNEKLYNYLCKELGDYNPKKEYVLSYWQYVKKSQLSNVNVRLKGIKQYNTSISFQSMMYQTDKPFMLSLWKYNGEHTFQDYYLNDIDEKQFPKFLAYIKEFFGIKPKYEQLSLFDT